MKSTIRLFEKNLDRLIEFKLDTELSFLDFDISPPDLKLIYSDLKAMASAQLGLRVGFQSSLMEHICETVARIVREYMNRLRDQGIIRVAILVSKGDTKKFLKIAHGYNIVGYADAALPIPLQGTPEGLAWTNGKPALISWLDYKRERSIRFPHIASLAWPERKWVLIVPIFNQDPNPYALVRIDSDIPLQDMEFAPPRARIFFHNVVSAIIEVANQLHLAQDRLRDSIMYTTVKPDRSL